MFNYVSNELKIFVKDNLNCFIFCRNFGNSLSHEQKRANQALKAILKINTGNVFRDTRTIKTIQSFFLSPITWPEIRAFHDQYFVPASRALDQNDSRHILNMPDKCIQEILRHLCNEQYILDAAEVCMKFQLNAIEYFRIEYYNLPENTFIPPNRLRRFLKLFGGSIKRIYRYLTSENVRDPENDDEYLNIVGYCCGKTLTTFDICGHYINFNKALQLQALAEMNTRLCRLYNFKPLPALKNIKFLRTKFMDSNFFTQQFPKLEQVEFNDIQLGFNDEMFIQFQEQNPQLKRLHVNCCSGISSAGFVDIHTRTPNLEIISCIIEEEYVSLEKCEADFLRLGKLSKLKSLELWIKPFQTFSTKAIIDAFAKNKVPIEELKIVGNDLLENLPNLKQLKRIEHGEFSVDKASKLFKNYSSLMEISRVYPKSVEEISEMLKTIENKTNIKLSVYRLSINLYDYNLILDLVKDRFRMVLDMYYGTVDVDKDGLQANSNWLDIHDMDA